LDLRTAVETALRAVARADDPAAPLGASEVLVVTAAPLGQELRPLMRAAHTGAVNGITTSVVALGSSVPLDEVDRLALAGQGNRRLLGAPAEAVALVDRELHAAGGVVARAVR